MSDISQGGAPAEVAPAPAAAPAPAPAPAEAAPGVPAAEQVIVDPFDAGQNTFGRQYVEKLRNEAAKYRTTAKPYEDAFGGYSEDDRAAWFQLAQEFQSNPTAAAEKFEKIAQSVKAQAQGVADVSPTAEAPAGEPMTRAQLDQLLAERDALQGIKSEMRDLGYTEGTADHREVLFLANQPGADRGNLQKAHEALQARKQSIIDDFLKAKAGQNGGPAPVTASGDAASPAEPITSFQSARESALARIRATQ